MARKKVVILFSRLSDYMLNCYKMWVLTHNVEIHVIRKPIDEKEAPFKFDDELKGIYFYDRPQFDLNSMLKKVKQISPDILLCSGWSDKEYLKVVNHYTRKIPTVMTMDNQWEGKAKQYIATVISPLYLTKKFSHIWVPGVPQEIYAKKLGFKDNQILKGFYVANSNNFDIEKINPERKFKKRFIYLGRYVDIKGIKDLWQAFIEMQDENPSEWELICIGAGPLYDEKIEHPQIKHIGFVQPKELKNYMSEGGVFVLPSHFEPWGVVVHEFALAGFPMIVSNKVGAASQFVKNGENGFIFMAKDIPSLKSNLISFTKYSDDKLNSMCEKSIEFSKTIDENIWVESINKIINE